MIGEVMTIIGTEFAMDKSLEYIRMCCKAVEYTTKEAGPLLALPLLHLKLFNDYPVFCKINECYYKHGDYK